MSIKEALLRTISESANRNMRALSTALLAGLEGVGPLLVQHPGAVAALLGRLEAGDAKRPRAADGGAAAAGPTEQAEEVEAAWALCSGLAQALSSSQSEGEAAEVGQAAADDGGAEAEAALGVLAEHADVLCRDWASSSAALGMHQAYVLARLLPRLAPRVGEAQAGRLQAALSACSGGQQD